MPNKLEVTLSFKPLMAGLDAFVNGINSRMEKVRAFNARIENGAKATNQLLAQAATILGAQQLASWVVKAEAAARAQGKLIEAARKQGQYGREYIKQLNDQADALERTTRASSEEISAVQRQFIAYGIGREDVRLFTQDALDLAEARNMGAESAAMLIGRMFAGDQEEIGRLGITLDLTKNRAVALHEAIQKHAGGQAQAAVVFPELHRAAVELDQARKDIGRTLAGIISPFIGGFTDGMRSAMDWVGRVLGAVREFAPSAENLRPLGELLGKAMFAALALLAPLLAIRAVMVGLPAVINPARAAFVLFAGVDMIDAVKDVQLFSKELGIVGTMKIATWGQRFAAFGAVVGSALAGWQIGEFVNELEVGGMKIGDWTARALNMFVGWAQQVGAAFRQAWILVKYNFFEKLTEGRMLILEFVDFVSEKLNTILPKKWQIPTESVKAAIAEYKKELGTLDAEKNAALAAIENRLVANLQLRSEVDADLAGKGRAGVAKPGTPEPKNEYNSDLGFLKRGDSSDLDAAKKAADARQDFMEQTTILRAQAEGNQKLVEILTRRYAEEKLLRELGRENRDIINDQLDAEQALKDKEVSRLQKEQQFSQALGDLAIQRANIEEDVYRTAEDKKKAILPLLQEEARLLKQRIENLILEKALATPTDRIQLQQQIDSLRAQLAENARGSAQAQPQTMMQGFLQGTNELFDSIGTKAQMLARGVQSVWQATASGIQSALYGVFTRTMTLGQGLKSIALGFGQSMLQALTQMVAEYATKKAAMFAIDMAFAAKGLLLSAASAAKSLVMWLPSAIAASISSWGTAAAIGAAAVIGIIAATRGFAGGGHVSGPGNGTSDSVNARLSNGEWVAPEWMVKDKRYGPVINMLESSRARGYKHGGFFQAMFASLGGYGPKAMLDFFVHPTGTGVLKNQQYLGLLGDSEHGSKASDLDPAFYQQTGFNLGSLPSDIASGMATPQYEASAASAGGGSGGGSAADLVDAVARKINVTAIVVPDEREAKRVARRGAAAGDVIFIVRNNRAQIFGNGPL